MIAYGPPGILILALLTLGWFLASWGLAVAICNALFNRDDRHGPFRLTVKVRELPQTDRNLDPEKVSRAGLRDKNPRL